MRSTLLTVLLIVIIAVIIGVLVKLPDHTPDVAMNKAENNPSIPAENTVAQLPRPAPSGDTLMDLQNQLQQEITAREALEKQVKILSEKVALLDKQTGISSTDTELENPDSPGSWFNEQALLEAGMNRAQAAELKTFYEQLEMDRLRVRDQAIREGWANSPRFGESLQAISNREDSLQDRLTEQDYDAYLYASGQNNRVEVSSVLASSPAATAGLQSGDQVLRYDNERIYDWRDLREATTEGNANETILVEVQRGDKQLQFYVPRGPLGIRMNSISAKP